jgi:hypothetical protein
MNTDDIDIIGEKLKAKHSDAEIAREWYANRDHVRLKLIVGMLMGAENALGLPLGFAQGPLVPRLDAILTAAVSRGSGVDPDTYERLWGLRELIENNPHCRPSD